MMNKFIFTLIAVTGVLLTSEYFFAKSDTLLRANIVMTGTLILAAITMCSFMISYNASLKSNPNQFVRGVMGATFLKFMLCILAAGVYIYLERKNINKPDLIFMMILYVIYTAIETYFLFSVSKKKHADR